MRTRKPDKHGSSEPLEIPEHLGAVTSRFALARGRAWIVYSAASWALIFAGFHIIWAAGWYPLLDAEGMRVAFAVPWKWWFDVVVAGMCIIAAPVSLALFFPWGQRVPRRALVTVAWIGTALLVSRAVASIVQTLYLIVAHGFSLPRMSVWEPWFYLGATLFSLNLWSWNVAQRASLR